VRVIGLDPGTRHFGWGVVERVGTRLVHVGHGVIDLDESAPLGARLVALESALDDIIARAHAPCASLETLFFAKDAQAAAKLGHARGVALLVCARARLETAEYAPAQVKRTVASSGRAQKEQVANMVRVLLRLGPLPRADAADALAIALTHLQRSPALLGPPRRPSSGGTKNDPTPGMNPDSRVSPRRATLPSTIRG
jgi:crossover junction endodeoxyribonuclease RuvC